MLVIPFGAHSQADANDVTPGTEPGAPHQLNLVKKGLIATVLAFVFLGMVFTLIELKIFDPYESGADPWAKSTVETESVAPR